MWDILPRLNKFRFSIAPAYCFAVKCLSHSTNSSMVRFLECGSLPVQYGSFFRPQSTADGSCCSCYTSLRLCMSVVNWVTVIRHNERYVCCGRIFDAGWRSPTLIQTSLASSPLVARYDQTHIELDYHHCVVILHRAPAMPKCLADLVNAGNRSASCNTACPAQVSVPYEQ